MVFNLCVLFKMQFCLINTLHDAGYQANHIIVLIALFNFYLFYYEPLELAEFLKSVFRFRIFRYA